MIMPSLVLVVDDRRPEAPRRIDPCSGDRNGREVHHKHREPDRQRHQNLHYKYTLQINQTKLIMSPGGIRIQKLLL